MSTLTAFIIGVLVGSVVVDFLWAWKFGIPQLFWIKVRELKRKIFN
jgi:hypothetical protein